MTALSEQTTQTAWWVVVLRGIAALVFGVLALAWPGLTLAVLVALFGAYAFVDGVTNIAGALERREVSDGWWVLLVQGIAGVLAGLLTLIWPVVTGLVLLFLLAARAIVVGVGEILLAIRLRKEITGEWLLATAGVLSVLFGLAIVLFPAGGALAVSWMVAWYAILAGVLLTVLGLRLRLRRGGTASGVARVA